jgi:hypothetical protein
MQEKSAFFPKTLAFILFSKKVFFRSTEAPPFSNLFISKYIHTSSSHKLKNEGTSVIFSRPYLTNSICTETKITSFIINTL